ncbi:MAG: GGDEF domain-containing protein [Acidimicrobiia bacterium]|nr:GGDEF domain-containing protein [Acidimicrobiia bacterium]
MTDVAMIPEAFAATRREMARTAAALFAAAATLSIVALVVGHGGQINEPAAGTTAVLGYVAAAALFAGGARVPRWLVHVVMAGGTVMVSIGVHTAGGGRVAGSASVFYLWVAGYAAYYFTRRAVVAHLLLITLSYAVVLFIEHEAAGPALWAGMSGTAAATAIVISSLSGRLRRLAATDPLTALPNRRVWESLLDRELARAARGGQPLCVAIADLDDFKAFNDEHGHHQGDRLLRLAAARWQASLRETDVLGRYGGDEFIAVLPDCPREVASDIACRLAEATPGASTCSVGVAWAVPTDDVGSLVARVDRALYRAKADGSGRVALDDGQEQGVPIALAAQGSDAFGEERGRVIFSEVAEP